jgi:hypothetical protein
MGWLAKGSSVGNASPSLAALFGRTVGWFVLCTAVWMQVNSWAAYPVAQLARFTLHVGADYWVTSSHIEAGQLEVDTRIPVVVAGSGGKPVQALLVAQADPARYGYSLPLFIALLLASNSASFWKRAALGYVLLLVPQTFSLVLELLRQIMVAGGSTRVLVVYQWQMEAIAMGYQVGSLLLPTVAPVALWAWLERRFLQQMVTSEKPL